MTTIARIAGLFAAGLIWAAVAASAQAPLEAFAVLQDRAPSISPDGTHFALIRASGGRPAVAIYETGASANTPPVIVTSPDWLIDGILWAKSDVLLIYSKKNMMAGLYDSRSLKRTLGDASAFSLKDHKQIKLSAYMQVDDVALDEPDVVYSSYAGSLFRVNVRDGRHNDVVMRWDRAAETQWVGRWILDGHGKVVARMDVEVVLPVKDHHWIHRLKILDNGDWREIAAYDTTLDRGDGVGGLSEDGHAMIRTAFDGKSVSTVRQVDIATGKETEIFKFPNYDAKVLLSDEWTGRVIGVAYQDDLWRYHYFDPKREALQSGLEKSFPGLSVHAVSTDVAQDKAIVMAEGPQTPPSYYLLDRNTHQATAIVASYPNLDESMLGTVKPYPYTARDGLAISAYLTLPPGRAPKNLPLVVMPHGGPDARDDMGFDWWAQFLANRGYAVLKPNYRGSSGYGRAFTEAGLHQWGLKMQDDISDGVKKAIADGIADPNRVCIVGASYGGYAALAGATLTPELYACAISYAGPSNLPIQLGYTALNDEGDIDHGSFWTTRIGNPYDDAQRLDATSPALHADAVRAPILLLHSENDTTVPIRQSELMFEALQRDGKKVEFARLEGDDHYLSLEATRVRMLREVERFLKASIGN